MIQFVSERLALRAEGNITWCVANSLCQLCSISYSNQPPKNPLSLQVGLPKTYAN